MIKSRLSTKSQTTIPRAVRDALQVREGEWLHWELADGSATLRKLAADDPFATFVEWDSPADREAYANL